MLLLEKLNKRNCLYVCNYAYYNVIIDDSHAMNFFVLSTLRNSDVPDINFSFKRCDGGDLTTDSDSGDKRIIVSTSIYNYLCKSKKTIETCNVDDWDAMKKYTNPYEFIHTIVPGHRCAISKMRPLSRSFYKMVEIIKHCKLLPPGCASNHNYHTHPHHHHHHRATATATATATTDSSSSTSSASSSASSSFSETESPINTFHLAEGPGGFIEALVHIRGNPDDVYHGMTLVDEHSFSCPGWKKSRVFLDRNPNVRLEYGADGTGNLLSLENYDACCAKYRQQMHFISADGGFDFSANFNNQESLAQNLVVAEVLYAITMQQFEGSFVLKIFDIFTKVTVDLLQLLCCVYDDVIVFKPNTSRIANSEKYVVCKRFNVCDKVVHDDLVNKFRAFFIGIGGNGNELGGDGVVNSGNIEIAAVLKTGGAAAGADGRHNMQLLNRIEEINAILGQQQIDNITLTISMIQTKTYDKLDAYKRANVQKCVAWCERYDIPCNKNVISTNTFITSTPSSTNATAGTATT